MRTEGIRPLACPAAWSGRTLGLALWAVTGAALSQGSPAAAGWWVTLDQDITRESNLYRLSEGAPTPAGLAREDTLYRTTVGAGARLPLGRQRVGLDLAWQAGRFDRNTQLDHDGLVADLRLDWETVGRLSGTLRARRDRSLVRFGSEGLVGDSATRNLGTTTRVDAGVRLGGPTRWGFELEGQHLSQSFSSAAFRSRELRQSTGWAGARYNAHGAWNAGLGLRALAGRYPSFALRADGSAEADRFDGRYLDLTGQWKPTGASQLDLRLSLGRTRYDRATASDLAGLTGTAAWTWRPTGKLQLQTRLARDRGQESATLFFPGSGRVADFSRTTRSLSATLDWSASAKVSLVLGGLWARRDLVDTRQDLFGRPLVLQGTDRTSVTSLAANWTPTRRLALGCEIVREQRTHQGPLSTDYGVSISGCRGRWLLD